MKKLLLSSILLFANQAFADALTAPQSALVYETLEKIIEEPVVAAESTNEEGLTVLTSEISLENVLIKSAIFGRNLSIGNSIIVSDDFALLNDLVITFKNLGIPDLSFVYNQLEGSAAISCVKVEIEESVEVSCDFTAL